MELIHFALHNEAMRYDVILYSLVGYVYDCLIFHAITIEMYFNTMRASNQQKFKFRAVIGRMESPKPIKSLKIMTRAYGDKRCYDMASHVSCIFRVHFLKKKRVAFEGCASRAYINISDDNYVFSASIGPHDGRMSKLSVLCDGTRFDASLHPYGVLLHD